MATVLMPIIAVPKLCWLHNSERIETLFMASARSLVRSSELLGDPLTRLLACGTYQCCHSVYRGIGSLGERPL